MALAARGRQASNAGATAPEFSFRFKTTIAPAPPVTEQIVPELHTVQGKPRLRVYVACLQWSVLTDPCPPLSPSANPTYFFFSVCSPTVVVGKFDATEQSPTAPIALNAVIHIIPARASIVTTTRRPNAEVPTRSPERGNEL